NPGDFDWAAIFQVADSFHVSGVTPTISASAAQLALDATRAAKSARVPISIDYNFRKTLWRWGKKAPEVMRELVSHAQVGIANEEDCQHALGITIDVDVNGGALAADQYCVLAERVFQEFPNLERQAITLRESHSAD